MRKRILFRADGYKQLGMGHIYNDLTLAESMSDQEVAFVTKKECSEGLNKLSESAFPVYDIDGLADWSDLEEVIEKVRPDIWVNDCLDTDREYIQFLKKRVGRVVTIEDRGEGSEVADAVINALYEDDDRKNVFSGWEYACLREEFLNQSPNSFRRKVKNVILMFGGTDPSNYNRLLYDIVLNIADKYTSITFQFITGIGYDAQKNNVISIPERNIYIYNNVAYVSEYMKNADIAITSQGRTIFELAAMGVPSIVLSQNEREQTHTFAQMDHGFLNLGLKDLSSELIGNTLDWLINTPPIRKNMYDLMTSLPLREGLYRVKDIIIGEERKGAL